jgi:hypothetical protein
VAKPDNVHALLAKIWRPCECNLGGSCRTSCCSLGNPSNKCDTVAAEGRGTGGTQALSGARLMPAPMEVCHENLQPVWWIEARLGTAFQLYAVTGSRRAIISHTVDAKSTGHALL